MCAPMCAPRMNLNIMKGVTNLASMQQPVLVSQVNGRCLAVLLPLVCERQCTERQSIERQSSEGIVVERIVARQHSEWDIPALS